METRSIEELLQLLLDNIHHINGRRLLDIKGLCGVIGKLAVDKLITGTEEDILDKYIHTRCNSFRRFFTNDVYYWKKGRRWPRKFWLQRRMLWHKLGFCK